MTVAHHYYYITFACQVHFCLLALVHLLRNIVFFCDLLNEFWKIVFSICQNARKILLVPLTYAALKSFGTQVSFIFHNRSVNQEWGIPQHSRQSLHHFLQNQHGHH